MKIYFTNPEKQQKFRMLWLDTLLVLFIIILSYVIRVLLYESGNIAQIPGRISWLVIPAVLVHLVSFYLFGLYDLRINKNRKILFINVSLSVIVASIGIAILSFVFPSYKIGRVLVFIHVAIMVIAVFYWRLFYGLREEKTKPQKTFIIGWDGITEKIFELLQDTKKGYKIKGVVIEGEKSKFESLGNLVPLYESMESAFRDKRPDVIVLQKIPENFGVFRNFFLDLKFEGTEIYDGHEFYQRIAGKVPVSELPASALILGGSGLSFQPPIYQNLKRIMDIVVSILVLVVSSPLCLMVALMIKMESKGPVLFRQERIGKYEIPFILMKFRTMMDDAERESGPCWATENDSRLTRVGRFLRKTRLDEFPQFINVLKGDMSLVGPRPIREYFAEQFVQKFPFYRLRFKVKPGITGWAQVNMSYVNTEEEQYEKLEYEIFYIYHQSIFLDLFIILKTAQSILKMRGG